MSHRFKERIAKRGNPLAEEMDDQTDHKFFFVEDKLTETVQLPIKDRPNAFNLQKVASIEITEEAIEALADAVTIAKNHYHKTKDKRHESKVYYDRLTALTDELNKVRLVVSP